MLVGLSRVSSAGTTAGMLVAGDEQDRAVEAGRERSAAEGVGKFAPVAM